MRRGVTTQKRFDAVLGSRRGLSGKQTRAPSPTFKIAPNGDKTWLSDGRLHCEDGPAIERTDGTKEWYRNGQRHRKNGPAVESPQKRPCVGFCFSSVTELVLFGVWASGAP
jgi:hypothetical protein